MRPGISDCRLPPARRVSSKLTVESFGKIVVVDQADDRFDFFSVARIEHACRHTQNAAKFLGDLGVAQQDWIIHRLRIAVHVETLALHPWLDDLRTFVIHIHTKDHQALGAILLIEIYEPGYLGTAWSAPGSPEIH